MVVIYRRNRSQLMKIEDEGLEMYDHESDEEETNSNHDIVNGNTQTEHRNDLATSHSTNNSSNTNDNEITTRSGRISRLPKRYRDDVC